MTNDSNDNVIPFPGIYKDHPPQTMEEVAEHLDFFSIYIYKTVLK